MLAVSSQATNSMKEATQNLETQFAAHVTEVKETLRQSESKLIEHFEDELKNVAASLQEVRVKIRVQSFLGCLV